jgi:hypothetical protein
MFEKYLCRGGFCEQLSTKPAAKFVDGGIALVLLRDLGIFLLVHFLVRAV